MADFKTSNGVKPGATPTSSPTSAPAKVKLSVTFTALDFTKLTDTHKVAMKSAVQTSVIAALLPAVYSADQVVVTLKAGSVIADVTITPLAGTQASAVSTSLDATKQSAMQKSAATSVSALPGIEKALASGKTKANIASDVTVSSPVVAAAQTQAPTTASTPLSASASSTTASPLLSLIFMIAMRCLPLNL